MRRTYLGPMCRAEVAFSSNTSSGLRPDAGTFASDITCAKAQISLRRNCVVSCPAERKVTKEKAAPVSRAVRVPCAACFASAAVELGLPKRKRFARTQTVLADFPEAKRAARRDTGAPTARGSSSCGAQ